MKRYIGTKVVTARPMNRADYNNYRGWTLPTNEDGTDEGFLVEYTDGGKPNDPRHEGYISWSPKEQFEGAYREREAVEGLQPHQQRVVDEKADLHEKANALSQFIGHSPIFAKLDTAEQERLKLQNDLMWQYLEVLTERVTAF